MNVDIERLRQDLIDYFGSVTPIYSMVIMDVINMENADIYKLIEIAKNNGFDLNNYIIDPYTRNLFK